MRVLVLGGTQFIGRASVGALLSRGHAVTVLNRGRSPNPFGAAVSHIACDRRGSGLAAALASEAWDAIVDFTAFEPSDVAPIVASRFGGVYIFVSTDSVYMACDTSHFVRAADGGLLEASSSTFDAARAAEDEYGADKWQTERALRAAAESGALARVLALRLPDVLGPHENTGRLEKLLSRLLKGRRVGCAILGTAACGEVPLGLVAADDVATAVCAAVEAPAPLLSGASTGEGGGSGVDDGGAHDCGSAATAAASPASNASSQPFAAVHVCSDERLTWRALVEQCAGAMRAHGLEVPPVRFDETRESGFVSVDVGALANGAAKEALRGWAPAPLRDRVAESVEWWVGSRHAERVARDAAPFRFAFDAPAPPDASSHQASQEEPPPAEERVVGQPPARSLKTEQ